MEEPLRSLGDDIHAEPKVRGSILAINRDIRFSRDKSPYKTHLDLWFWQGDGPSRERPGYFVRLQAAQLVVGAGMHQFTDQGLVRFRHAIASTGGDLHTVIDKLAPTYELGGQTLKRTPKGCEDDLARYTGLFAQRTTALPHELFATEATDFCMVHFRRLAPLQQWLTRALSA
jgi:uncharacterized protein (TIGR02453 family)